MINWTFVVILSSIVAAVIELLKKIPFLAKEWKSETLRSVCIMAMAFVITAALACFVGISLSVATGIAQGISYTIIVFCVQKLIGEEVFHKALKKKVETA